MSVLGKLLKGTVTGIANGTYDLYKDVENSIQNKIELAKIAELEEREASYKKEVAHFSEEEREKMLSMAKNFSMVQMAKRSANDKNELHRLKFKHNLLGGSSKPKIETK